MGWRFELDDLGVVPGSDRAPEGSVSPATGIPGSAHGGPTVVLPISALPAIYICKITTKTSMRWTTRYNSGAAVVGTPQTGSHT